ncbi:MAG TPA: CsgG/HfaB family protein [Vicinamibacterales bacterium]|nr:CsgG/HfaB family protein [Vicinamibacterales bacterium]
MRHPGRVLMVLALGVWAIPAAAQQKPNDKNQERLEKAVEANPGSVAANRALGIWYYKASRFTEALVPLQKARSLDPKDGVTALYVGLAAEATRDYTTAKAAYTAYLAVGKTRSVRNDIRVRLVSVTREEAQEAAKAAVANEAQIAQVPGSPTTVAVLPFTIEGSDANLQPLQVGLADLVISDLAKPKKITVVERDKIQAISDEIALSKNGQVDAATAVRAGKLIRAGRIVKGALISTGASNITMTSTTVNTQNSATVGTGLDANGTLDKLFDMEKQLVFATFADLGVTLTPAEHQDVDRRPTHSLQAFIDYSRGLMAEDAGRLDEAARFFESARAADPGFGAALQRAQTAAAASQNTNTKIESNLKGSSEGQTVAAAASGNTISANLTTTLSTVVGDVNPTTTNAVATTNVTVSTSAPPVVTPNVGVATGTSDQPTARTGQVTIVIKKP